jgi:hypothetical protein
VARVDLGSFWLWVWKKDELVRRSRVAAAAAACRCSACSSTCQYRHKSSVHCRQFCAPWNDETKCGCRDRKCGVVVKVRLSRRDWMVEIGRNARRKTALMHRHYCPLATFLLQHATILASTPKHPTGAIESASNSFMLIKRIC